MLLPIDEAYFTRKWNSSMAWLLGYTWADGCVMQHKNGYVVKWGCTENDAKLIKHIKKEIKSLHKLTKHKARTNFGIYKSQAATYLQISNYNFIQPLINRFKIPFRKSFIECKFPRIPDKFALHFVRGYFDGDGAVSIHSSRPGGRITISCSSKTFIKGLQNKICKLTKIRKGKISKSGATYQIVWHNKNDIETLFAWLYPTRKHIRLDRKYKSFKLLLRNLKQVNGYKHHKLRK